MKRYIIEVEARIVNESVAIAAEEINRLLNINGKTSVLTEKERDDSVRFAEQQIAACSALPKNSLAVKVYEREFHNTSAFQALFDKVKEEVEFEDYTIYTSECDGYVDGMCIDDGWFRLDIAVIKRTTTESSMRKLLRAIVVKYLYDFNFEE